MSFSLNLETNSLVSALTLDVNCCPSLFSNVATIRND
jgi:hypothetical protein